MKSFTEIFKSTFTGANEEGSSKRVTSFYFVAILLTSMTMVYEYCFYLAVSAVAPSSTQVMVVKMFDSIHYSLQLTIWMLLGLATVETITALIRTVRGGDKKEETKSQENA